ncbi:MAG: hypothetical protein EA359_04610 [Balneolaceae bacterium]|nr:MAG: hypothetical protein EA359_04610 [Balneolaceae bacterium]
MGISEKTPSAKIFYISIFCFAVLSLTIAFLLTEDEKIAWITGYMLGLFAVVVHLASSFFSKNSTSKQFTNIYYISLFLRFLIVLLIYALILVLLNFDEFSFTVSFIISYLFHSVNEVILLNRKFSN